MHSRLLRSLIALAVFAWVARADNATFTYDDAGRLTGTTRNGTNITAYQYDVSGNLTGSLSYVVMDSDQDGMGDSFEMLYFETLSRDGLGDFDLDGLNDLGEYLAGTDPTDNASFLRMDRVLANTVELTIVSWFSVPGKLYRVQYKNSLTDPVWSDLPGDVAATGGTTSKADTTKTEQPNRYYRVQVLP